jgi:hypothetical protein
MLRYIISRRTGVFAGNYIFRDEKPKPASIAAIPNHINYIVGICICLPEMEL